MTIEIVDFPIENGGFFYSYVNVYQRVVPIFREPEIMKNHEKNHHVSWSRWVFFVVVKNHVESPCCMVKNPGHSYGLRSFHIAYGKCFMDDTNLYHTIIICFTSLKCWFCLKKYL